MTKDYDYDACVDLITAIIKPAREADNQLWRDLQKSGVLKEKKVDALELAHWLAEYIDGFESIELKMSNKDFKRLIGLIEKIKEVGNAESK